MLRYVAPLDRFINDASLWFESMAMMWILMAISFAIVLAVVVLARRRQRAQARVPRYRRMSTQYSRRDTER